MDHSQIQPTPGGDWKTSPHSHFAARLVEKPLEEEFHSPISARSGKIPDRAHTALDTTFSQPPPPAAADQVKCEVVTLAASIAVSAQSGLPKIARELSLMDTAKPRTIFITGATGLVGGHAAEEALRRGHPVRALSAPAATPAGSTSWGSRRSWETWRTPNRCGGESPVPTGSSTVRPRWATGARSQNSAASTSMPSGYSSTRPATLKSSDSCTSARWASTRVATITAPTRPSRRRPALLTLTPAPRLRPRPSS